MDLNGISKAVIASGDSLSGVCAQIIRWLLESRSAVFCCLEFNTKTSQTQTAVKLVN